MKTDKLIIQTGIILLVVLSLVSFGLRIHHLNQPFNTSHDWKSVNNMMKSERIYTTHEYRVFKAQYRFVSEENKKQLNTFSMESPLLNYLLVATFFLLDPSPLSGRLLTTIFGILSLLLFFYVVNHYWNTKTALLATALFTISPIHTFYSGNVEGQSLATFFLVLLLWITLYITRKRDFSPITITLMLFVALLAQLSKLTLIVFIIPYLLFTTMQFWKYNARARTILLILYGGMLLLAVLLLTILSHNNTGNVIEKIIEATIDTNILFSAQYWLLLAHYAVLLVGIVPVLGTYLFLCSSIHNRYLSQKNILVFLFLLSLTPFILFYTLQLRSESYHLTPFLIPLTILGAQGLQTIKPTTRMKKIFWCLLIFVGVTTTTYGLSELFGSTNLEVIPINAYLKENMPLNTIIIMPFPEPLYGTNVTGIIYGKYTPNSWIFSNKHNATLLLLSEYTASFYNQDFTEIEKCLPKIKTFETITAYNLTGNKCI